MEKPRSTKIENLNNLKENIIESHKSPKYHPCFLTYAKIQYFKAKPISGA